MRVQLIGMPRVSLAKTTCEGCQQPIHTHELIQRLAPFQYRHKRCAK